jgi:hypothetical protein
MDSRDDFQKAMRRFVKGAIPASLELAQVTAYDSATETVKVKLIDGFEIFGVRLTAKNTDYKIITIPKHDSWVLVGRIADSDSFSVLQYSEVEKVKGIMDGTSFEVDASGVKVTKDTTEFEVDASGVKILRGGQNVKNVLLNFMDLVKIAQYIGPSGTNTLSPPQQAQIEIYKTQLNAVLK